MLDQQHRNERLLEADFQLRPYGNRRFDASQTTDPAITPQNQNSTNPGISETTNQISPTEYRYDAAGNLECDPMHPCGQASPFPAYYKYDAENRIKEANGGAANGGSTYIYDGDGLRVTKTVGTARSIFVYNIMGKLVAEYTNLGAVGSRRDEVFNTRSSSNTTRNNEARSER